jgi:FkbM family methyltransferase
VGHLEFSLFVFILLAAGFVCAATFYRLMSMRLMQISRRLVRFQKRDERGQRLYFNEITKSLLTLQEGIEDLRSSCLAISGFREELRELHFSVSSYMESSSDAFPKVLSQVDTIKHRLGALENAVFSLGNELTIKVDDRSHVYQVGSGELTSIRLEVSRLSQRFEAMESGLVGLRVDTQFFKNRIGSYLGSGVGLTYLVDQSPVFINTLDYGCSALALNGGRYEESYLNILRSFRRPEGVFLDLGANLGLFSIRMASWLKFGVIYAFEPNNTICELFRRSVFLNGFSDRIKVYGFGASNRDGLVSFVVPDAYSGGGRVVGESATEDHSSIEVRKLDSVLADLGSFDLAKIDVEGHEFNALVGMGELIKRSPDAVILFEKLGKRSGDESSIFSFFSALDFSIFSIVGSSLKKIDLEDFEVFEGNFIAARPSVIGTDFDRNFFFLFPLDFATTDFSMIDGVLKSSQALTPGALLFHGPYWYLERGVYSIFVDGVFSDPIEIIISENFGHKVVSFEVSNSCLKNSISIPRDLCNFEVIGKSVSSSSSFSIASIKFTLLG